MATDMIVKLAGGEPSKARVAGKPPIKTNVVAFDLARVEKLAGIKVEETEARRILTTLGFAIEGKGAALKVTVPSWRPDVHGPADIVEEVVRIVGLDKVPSTPLPRAQGVARAVLTERQRRAKRSRRLLAGRGFVEAVTWSFIPPAQAQAFGGGAEALELANPISTEMSSMRPGLLPGLLTAAQRNRNRGFADVALFEIGQAYTGIEPDQQLLLASGVRVGEARLQGQGRHWSGSAGEAGLFDVKADVMATLAALGLDATRMPITRDAPAWFHPGRSGALRLGPKVVLAHFGEMHPAALKALDVEGPAAAFEIFLKRPAGREEERSRPSAFHGRRSAPRAARLRLRAGGQGRRRRCRPRRVGRRQGADRRCAGVRPVPGRQPRCRQEVAGNRGHAAAARQDADRRRDRRGVEQGRRGGQAGHRRRGAVLAVRECARLETSVPHV